MNRGFSNTRYNPEDDKQQARRYQGPNVFLRLSKYLLAFRWTGLLAMLLVVAANVLALLGPYLSGKAIDAIHFDSVTKTANVDFPTVYRYCAYMVLFYLLSAGLSYIRSLVMTRFSQKITRRIRSESYNKLLSLPVAYFDKLQAGDVISRLSYDIDTINTSLTGDLVQILTSLITVTGAFVMMVSISWKMLLVFLITVPMSIFVTIKRSRMVRPLFRKRSAALGALNGYTEEILSGSKTIKAYGKEEEFARRYGVQNAQASEAYFMADYQAATIGPSVNFINNLSMAIISVAGACLFISGSMSFGAISAFILYGRKFSGPINEFSNILADLQSLRSASERVFTLMDEDPELPDDPDAVALTDVKGEIEFRNVKFSYVPEKEIIHGLSLKVPAGKTVAIVGPTGGGKTTIVNLLMRFYDRDSGVILLDGIPINKICRDDLRKAYTMVLQETWLMGGTVAENIAYGKKGATREEIEEAAKRAGIHKFILSLPKGYDTRMEDGGLNISKGQKQLLTIARSMLSDAKMLILDEATSNVDTRTEIKIEKAMLKLMEGKTCFVIAHRLSTVKNADMIMVVRDGDVVETGTHRSLLEQNGFYAELYRSQYV
ncbi:MAG: ABC transporter ATP-binding protein [Ruminococcaceae bacterium]|nr:ABC transporter ATP-binding protein [Oscillospiraceae bacterium]